MAAQQDVILEINKFSSMNSFLEPVAIEDNQFQAIVNFRFKGNVLEARPPHKRTLTNATTGNLPVVGAGVFRTSSTTYKVFGTNNGKLWQQSADDATPVELTLSGGNALTTGNRISMTQYLSRLYVVDGVNLLEWDGSGTTVTSRTSKLPIDITAPVYIISWLTRIVVADSLGRIALAKQEASFVTDPTPFDTTAGGFSVPVANGDGLLVTSIVAGQRILAISKQLVRDKITSIHTLTGTSSANFELRESSPSTGFLGSSGVQIGSDLFGLTPSGFRWLSTIQELGEATQSVVNTTSASFENRKVPDYVSNLLEDINYTYANLITGIYNDQEQAYYCAIPYGSITTKNNLVIRIEFTDNDVRFSLYTDTFAQKFFKSNGYIYYIDNTSQIWKMNDLTQSTYEEQAYHKLLITKLYNFQQISTTHLVTKMVPEVKAYKADKEINVFYNTYRSSEEDGTIQFETNKTGVDGTIGEQTVYEWTSIQPNRFDFVIADFDTFDGRISRMADKELPAYQNVERVQGIISHQENDTTGLERFDLRMLQFKGKPIKENNQ